MDVMACSRHQKILEQSERYSNPHGELHTVKEWRLYGCRLGRVGWTVLREGQTVRQKLDVPGYTSCTK